MDNAGRARRALIVFWSLIALPLVLWLVPATRWAANGQARRAFGRIDWTTFGVASGDIEDGWWYADYYDRQPIGESRDARLVRASNVLGNERIDAAYPSARANWNDPQFLANYLLEASQWAPVRSVKGASEDLRKWIEDQKREHRTDWLRVRKVCDQGMRLEPDNAFFPALAAAACDGLDDQPGALAYLRRAGGCRQWNDHAAEITAIRRKVMLSQFGYRGWEGWSFLAVWPSSWAPDLHSLARDVAYLPFDATGIEARKDLIQIAELAYAADASSYYGSSSASGSGVIVAGLASSGANSSTPLSVRREAQLGQIHRMSVVLAPDSPGELEGRLREMLAATDFTSARNFADFHLPPGPYSDPGDVISIPITEYGIGAMILAAGLALLLLIGAAGLAMRLPKAWIPGAALPGVAAAFVAAGAAVSELRDPTAAAILAGYAVVYLVVGILSARSRWEEALIVGGILVPCLATFGIYELTVYDLDRDLYPYQITPVAFFSALALWRLATRRWSESRFLLVPQLGVLLFGLMSTFFLGPHTSPTKSLALIIGFGFLLLVLVAGLQRTSLAEAARQVRRYSYWPAALCALGFCGAVIWQTVADRHEMLLLRREESISPVIRSWARAHPDGLLAQMQQDDAHGVVHGGWP
ncbi:MAG TPA: hypothetical protein VMI31_00525 [Fimbriimonadaceae bacterium]|nr:hypothetical protein [Fimbriimonadaceae bacterium]